VRAVFECSYRALDAGAAALFRLLGAHWGPDITVAATASLAGVSVTEAERALAVLAEASLVQEHQPGRYTMHDLLRAYARELANGDPESRRATGRVLDHYVHTAYRADLLVYPAREPIAPPAAATGVTAERFTDRDGAVGWFTAERAVLLGAFAGDGGELDDAAVWQLAWALSNVLNLQGHWRDQEYAQRGAVAAARRLRDPLREAHALRALGRVQDVLRQDTEAVANLRRALELFDAAGDRAGAAQTHINLARVCERHGATDERLAHDEASLRLYRELGSRTGQARALNNIGGALTRKGRYAEALEACQASLDLCRELGNVHGEANARLSIADIHEKLGEQAAAALCIAEAVRLYREAHDRPQEARSLTLLGDAYSAAGDERRARVAWKEAVALLDDLAIPAEDVRARLDRRARVPA
jgi:tetratricopeptide (TPR) repeat protein